MLPYRLYATGLMMAIGVAATSTAQTNADPPLSKEIQSRIQAQDALSAQVAPIKSQADVIQYMNMVPPQSNAMYLLSPAARERFVSSLTFNQHGLSGFSYADLQRELPPAKIARVLRLFGSESSATTIQTQGGTKARPGRQESGLGGDCGGFQQSAWGTCDSGDGPIGGGLPGGVPGGAGGGGAGAGGGPSKPPSEPVGQEPQPKPMPNGDYWNYRCEWGGGGCAHQTNSICKAKC